MRTAAALVLAACAALTIACGDDGGSTTSPTPAPSPSPSPPATSSVNPCAAARAVVAALDGARTDKAQRPTRVDPRGTLGDILWRHAAAEGRLRPLAATAPGAAADVGEIAVIQDEGDIIAPAN